MENWIFLHEEPNSRIKEFAYALGDKLGDYWDFSEFVPGKTARQPTNVNSLEDCFKEEKVMRDKKLVIGQEFSAMGPIKEKIRLAFRYGNIWADYITDNTSENYNLTKEIFKEVFKYPLENYPFQQSH